MHVEPPDLSDFPDVGADVELVAIPELNTDLIANYESTQDQSHGVEVDPSREELCSD